MLEIATMSKPWYIYVHEVCGEHSPDNNRWLRDWSLVRKGWRARPHTPAASHSRRWKLTWESQRKRSNPVIVAGFEGSIGNSFGLTGTVYMKWFLTPNTGAVMEKMSRGLLKQRNKQLRVKASIIFYVLNALIGQSDHNIACQADVCRCSGCSMSGTVCKKCLNKIVFTLSQTQLAKDYFCIFCYRDVTFPPRFCFCFTNKGNFATVPQSLTTLLNPKSTSFEHAQKKNNKAERVQIREILSFITSLSSFWWMGALFQLNEVISVVCFLWCAWRVWPKPGSAPAAGLLRCCRREEKNIRGGKKERVHDIISPGLLRSSPVEGWERWPTFPSELPSPVSSPPGSLEHKVTEHRLKDILGNTI